MHPPRPHVYVRPSMPSTPLRSPAPPATPVAAPRPIAFHSTPPRAEGEALPIVRNHHIQLFLLELISELHRAVYSEKTRANLRLLLKDPAVLEYLNHPETTHKYVYRFYLKGGNAYAMIRTRHSAALHAFPFPLESDFDMVCMINPRLSEHDFDRARVYLMYVLTMFKESSLWDLANSAYPSVGLTPLPLDKTLPIPVNQISGGPTDDSILKYLNSEGFNEIRIPPGCPYIVRVVSNIAYETVGANGRKVVNTVHNALLKYMSRTTPAHELVDIAIPSRAYANLATEWDLYEDMLFKDTIYTRNIAFYVLDPVMTYIDLRYAARMNTRPKKKANRSRRANSLRNALLTGRKNYARRIQTLRNSGRRLGNVAVANLLSNISE